MNVDNTHTSLQDLDLEPKEASVYQTCVQEGTGTPTLIAKKTGIKRSTVYFYLDRLSQKGLLTITMQGARKQFSVPAPRTALKRYLREKQLRLSKQAQGVEALITHLESLPRTSSTTSHVFFYEDTRGLTLVLDSILAAKKDIRWVGSIETLLSIVPKKTLYTLFSAPRLKQGTVSRAITDRRILSYQEFGEQIGNKRMFRFVKDDLLPAAILCIFGNSIALLSQSKGHINVVLVENESMAAIMRILFEALWSELTTD